MLRMSRSQKHGDSGITDCFRETDVCRRNRDNFAVNLSHVTQNFERPLPEFGRFNHMFDALRMADHLGLRITL